MSEIENLSEEERKFWEHVVEKPNADQMTRFSIEISEPVGCVYQGMGNGTLINRLKQ